jgi:hypothetical protein
VGGKTFPPQTRRNNDPYTNDNKSLLTLPLLISLVACQRQQQKHTSDNTPCHQTKKIPSLAEAQTNGSRFIKEFFPAIKKPGRPKMTEEEIAEEIANELIKKPRGRPPKNQAKNQAVDPEKRKPPPSKSAFISKKQKRIRTNWSLSLHREKLEQALEQWKDKGPATMDENGEPFSLTA